MRFLFRPPAAEGATLLALPWESPLEEWDDEWLLDVPSRGLSRHVVRFVAAEGRVYALKEIDERLARHEYAVLGDLEAAGMPVVSVLGICVDRPEGQPAILVTRFLEYALPYRHLFSGPRSQHPAEQLVDALVVLLVRLHLAGVFWGDCSLSNALVRPDAGELTAHLVDAETVERHPRLTDGQRGYDVDLAVDRVGAELLDLEFGGLLPRTIDPVELAVGLRDRYEALWSEVTAHERVGRGEQRWRVAARMQRLGDLGFDAGEVELVGADGDFDLRVQPRVALPGAHRHELFRLTGLEVTENQARRLLGDLRSYRAYLESVEGGPVSETVAGHRWVTEKYLPVVDGIPRHLHGRLAPAEVFHQILEHRWFLSEAAGADVGTAVAAASYLDTVLVRHPAGLTTPGALIAP
jgi:hypothetical protein